MSKLSDLRKQIETLSQEKADLEQQVARMVKENKGAWNKIEELLSRPTKPAKKWWHLFVLALLFVGCSKQPSTITWSGSGDVVITDGILTTDFQNCPEGWKLTRPARPSTVYTIQGSNVKIKHNVHTVAVGVSYAKYKTP